MAAKKSMKAAATAGTSVFEQIASGNAQNIQDVANVQDVLDVQDTQAPLVRLNLRLPADIKEYLQAAAYRESSAKHTVTITEYLCKLIRADMEKHKAD